MSRRTSIRMSLVSLLLATSLLACGDEAGGGSGTGVEAFTIQGILSNWGKGDASSIKAYAFLGLGTSGNKNDQPFASTPLDSAGSFKIALPEGTSLAPWLFTASANPAIPSGCTSTVTYNPATVGSVGLQLKVVDPTNSTTNIYHRIPSAAPSAGSVGYVYVDRDFSQVGEMTCTIAGTMSKQVYDLHYKKGWNTATSTSTTGGGSTTTTAKSGPPPANAYWTSSLF